ncbi:MAG: sugar phosphate isomerase/epimerase [Anaerolineales bacterium]|nr:sugar phosphate isomerase/epimerase [Anaerolineales bacterium]
MHFEKAIGKPQLGLNMHPQWLGDGKAGDFLFPLRERGLSVLEFTLNLSSSDWPEMRSLIEECHQLGFRVTFHAPYKAPHNPAGFSGAERDEVVRLYRPALAYAARIAEAAGATTLVVHGAKGNSPREELRRDTRAFLAWILEKFPGLSPCIELLVKEERTNKIGDNKAELAEIVSGPSTGLRPALKRSEVAGLGLPEVGICWDLGHDACNGSVAAPPGFIASVRHVHVHDISPNGEDHNPLVFGNVSYEDYLRRLNQAGYRGAIILEVDGQRVSRFAATQGKHPRQILQDNLLLLEAMIDTSVSKPQHP